MLWEAMLIALGSVQQRDSEHSCDRCRQRLFARLAGVSNAYRHTQEDDARYRCFDGAMGIERCVPHRLPMSVSSKMGYHEPEVYGPRKFHLHLLV